MLHEQKLSIQQFSPEKNMQHDPRQKIKTVSRRKKRYNKFHEQKSTDNQFHEEKKNQYATSFTKTN